MVELADTDATATLRGLYAQIGGRYVQPVQLAADLVMWVDEDGLLAEHPVMNRAATLLGGALGRCQVYVGTVVYTGADRHGTRWVCPMSGSRGCADSSNRSALPSRTSRSGSNAVAEVPRRGTRPANATARTRFTGFRSAAR